MVWPCAQEGINRITKYCLLVDGQPSETTPWDARVDRKLGARKEGFYRPHNGHYFYHLQVVSYSRYNQTRFGFCSSCCVYWPTAVICLPNSWSQRLPTGPSPSQIEWVSQWHRHGNRTTPPRTTQGSCVTECAPVKPPFQTWVPEIKGNMNKVELHWVDHVQVFSDAVCLFVRCVPGALPHLPGQCLQHVRRGCCGNS